MRTIRTVLLAGVIAPVRTPDTDNKKMRNNNKNSAEYKEIKI